MRRQQRAAKQRRMQRMRRWVRGIMRECATFETYTTTEQEPMTIEALAAAVAEMKRLQMEEEWPRQSSFVFSPADGLTVSADFGGKDRGVVAAYQREGGQWWLRGLVVT